VIPSQTSEGCLGFFEGNAVAALGAVCSRGTLAGWVGSRRRQVANAVCPGASNAEAVLDTTRTAATILNTDRLLATVVGVARRRILPRADVVWIVALDHVTELLSLRVKDPALVSGSTVGVARHKVVVFVPALDPGDIVDFEETGLDFFTLVILDCDRLLALVEVGLKEVATNSVGVLQWNRPF